MRVQTFTIKMQLSDDDQRTSEELSRVILAKLSGITVTPCEDGPVSMFTGRRHRPVMVPAPAPDPEPEPVDVVQGVCPVCALAWAYHPHSGCMMPEPLDGDLAGTMKTAATIAGLLKSHKRVHGAVTELAASESGDVAETG